MASMLYGGALTSKLFVNVREKLSLCYYASSRVDKWKGLMFVQSGIEFSQYQRALDEILFQLEECRKGRITREELTSAFNTAATLYNAIGDSPLEMEEFYVGQAVAGLTYGAGDFVEMCRGVTVDDAARAAGSFSLDTTYFLRGLED